MLLARKRSTKLAVTGKTGARGGPLAKAARPGVQALSSKARAAQSAGGTAALYFQVEAGGIRVRATVAPGLKLISPGVPPGCRLAVQAWGPLVASAAILVRVKPEPSAPSGQPLESS